MLVTDQNELDKFINILPELQREEVYFLSLSARNKYLTAEERIAFQLGRTEMFSREICRDKEAIYKAINKMEYSLYYRKTNNGRDIPPKCLVMYMNINPSSMMKAYNKFQKEINIEMEQITFAYINGNQPNFERMKRLPQQLNKCIQSSSSRKCFTDIDIDLSNLDYREELIDRLKYHFNNDEDVYFILTKGGIHILMKQGLAEKYRAYLLVSAKNENIKEIEFNKNNMVPIPGTMQAGVLVRMI